MMLKAWIHGHGESAFLSIKYILIIDCTNVNDVSYSSIRFRFIPLINTL